MKIITLVEDSQQSPDFGYEHGVSFYIETRNHRILFDLGQTDLFIKNALKLNIDLKKIDTVIISHGHYDHGGGLNYFLSINDKAKIYIQKSAFADYYSMRKKNEYTYIGLDKSLDHNKFVLLKNDFVIDNELTLLNQIDTSIFFPMSNQTLFKKANNNFILDDFSHEQSLLIKSDGLNVLFAGCAHKGIINIINQAEESINGNKIDALFGGFHLKSRYEEYQESSENIQKIAKILKEKNVKKYYTGHCTGTYAYKIFKTVLKDRIANFYPGLIVYL
jgi:7,8-dihydropterin-6-yl-methyl-4-(beta-D-ribofuranosyl)aminobenzene 5'-phosphate synthase